MSKPREIHVAHIPDAVWIIALYKYIYGGDPSPEQIAGRAIASLAPYLATENAVADAESDPHPWRAAARAVEALSPLLVGQSAGTASAGVTMEVLQQRLNSMNITVTEGEQEGAKEAQGEKTTMMREGPSSGRVGLPYCFHWAGQTICIPRPQAVRSLAES